MGLFNRISDIISANLSDMVEHFEDPEKMLKQAIREMEESIETSKQEVVKAMANEKLVAKELAANELHMHQWRERAATAISAGDENLARKALTRKQEHERIVMALKDQHAAALEASTTLRRQLDAMQAKLAEAKRHLGTLVARKKAADARSKLSLEATGASLDDKAFAKFDKLREKVERAEAEAEAIEKLCTDGALAGEVRQSMENLELEAELAQLKKELSK